MVVKNTQIRVAKTHYRAQMRWRISVRHADCQPEQQGWQAGGTAAVWQQEGQYLLPAVWLLEFISVISITPGNSNRDQNVEGEEEKQKRAWESILMRRKREVHITRAAGSQSTHGPLQHFPTGSKLSHLAWFPRKLQVRSHAPCVCLPYAFQPNFRQWHSLKAVGIPMCFAKPGRQGYSGRSWVAVGLLSMQPLDIPHQSSEKPHKMCDSCVWLLV